MNDLEVKIKRCESNWIEASLLKEKESLHISLGIANSQWAELMWVLDE